MRPRKTNHRRSKRRNRGQVKRRIKQTAKKKKAKLPKDQMPQEVWLEPVTPPTVMAPQAPPSTTHYSVEANKP